MRTILKYLIGISFILNILSCFYTKLPPKESIPSNIPKDVRTEIEGLYYGPVTRAYSSYSLGEMGRLRAKPAIPFLIGILEDNTQLEKVEEHLFELLERETPKTPARIAAVALIKIGRPALKPLMENLIDRDNDVRFWAAAALGEIDPYWQKSEMIKSYIPKFMEALKSENWHERANAAQALGKVGNKSAVEVLIAALKDKESNVRANAAKTLGTIKDTRAAEPLIAILNDNESDVQVNSVWALGEIRDNRSLKPLNILLKQSEEDLRAGIMIALSKLENYGIEFPVEALGSKDKNIRERAIEALVKIGKPKPLISALESKNRHVREYAAAALGKIGDTQAVPPLLKALKDEYRYVRANAALALGAVGDSQVIKPLIAALRDKSMRVRWRATWALGKIGAPAIKPLIDVLKYEEVGVQERAAEALREIGTPAVVPMITALGHEYSNVQHWAQIILGWIGKRAVEPLISELQDKNSTVLYGAIKTLMAIGDKRAVEPLLVTLKDSNEDVGQISAETLGRLGDKRAVEPLLEILEEDAYNKRLRDWASWALGEIKDVRAVKPLIEALSDDSKLVQRSAADALGKIGKPATDVLVHVLRDKNYKVRLGVAKSLEKINWQPMDDTEKTWFLIAAQRFDDIVGLDMAAVGPLIEVLKDPDWKIRKKAAWTLGMIEDWEPEKKIDEIWFLIASRRLKEVAGFGEMAVEPLIISLKGKNKNMRKDVAGALRKIGSPAIEPLVALLRNNDWDIRRKAVEVLGNIGDGRAVEPLIAALNDRDWDVRAKSAWALGNIDDPRAIEPLVAALKDENSDVRLSAANALYKVYWKPKKKINEAWFMIAYLDWDGVGKLGAVAVEPLLLMLKDEDFNIMKMSAETLAMIGTDAVEPLITALQDKNKDVREGALRALGQIGDHRAIAPLKELAEKDRDSHVRKEAQKALEEIQTRGVKVF